MIEGALAVIAGTRRFKAGETLGITRGRDSYLEKLGARGPISHCAIKDGDAFHRRSVEHGLLNPLHHVCCLKQKFRLYQPVDNQSEGGG